MRIRLLQSTVFRDRKSLSEVQPEFRAHASTETQNVPDWVANDPYFQLLEDSGKLEIVTSSAARRIVAANQTPNLGLAGAEVTTDADVDVMAARENALNKQKASLLDQAGTAPDPAADAPDPAKDAAAKAAAAKAAADADAAKSKNTGK